MCRSYPKDKKAVLAAELAKFTNNDDHRESVRLLDQVFKPIPSAKPGTSARKPRKRKRLS